MNPEVNPFAALSLIVAPAILTNATAVLIMSTSTRLARAVDRARELSRLLEEAPEFRSAQLDRRLRELTATEERAMLLIRSLSRYYAALGGFAAATLLSLLGAVVVPFGAGIALPVLEFLAVLSGVVGVGGLVTGSVLLVRETRIAVETLRDNASEIRAQAASKAGRASRPGPS